MSEIGERALFFATSMSMTCTKILQEYISHCEHSLTDLDLNRPSSVMSKEEHRAAVKELLCVSILLAFLEQHHRGALPQFDEFTAACWEAADLLLPLPKSSEVVAPYNSMSTPEDIRGMVSMILCHKLRTGTTSVDASLFLGTLLKEYRDEREFVLHSALSEPLNQLDKQIETYATAQS